MIKNIRIENYALIESLDIDFHSGFSVITGETGAGKSIILGAIGLLLGQRADSKSIKTNATKCVVEATFDVSNYELASFFDENDLDFDGQSCVIRREVTSAGKSRAFINDTPVQLTMMKEIGEKLIDIHSQHKNLLLGNENFQLNVLDIFAQNADVLNEYKSKYKDYKDICEKYDEAVSQYEKVSHDEDYLRFLYNELSDANLSPDEQNELEKESETLSHSEDIKQALGTASSLLSDGGESSDSLQLIRQCLQSLQSITSVYDDVAPLCERLDTCYIELKDISDEIVSLDERVEYNPTRLEWVNERLNVIYSLQKKHHVQTVDELLKLRDSLDEKLSLIDNNDEIIEELRKKRDNSYAECRKVADKLSERRVQASVRLEGKMVELLLPLGMPNVRFKVDVNAGESFSADDNVRLTPTGYDTVNFLFSANKNSALQSVSQVASGGEIARVMLSMKAMIAGIVKLPTIIFDEIDTGVSGSIAEKMAKMMREMGDSDRQVISITHLPQIAAMGAHHYKVYKEDNEESTVSHIVELTNDQRVEEVAHMLSGEVLTEAALENAKSLLKS